MDEMTSRALPLPDPAVRAAAYQPFQCDPGWDEAWWWLGLPCAIAAFLIGTHTLYPEWYRTVVFPEGYGLQELFHFFVPLIGFVIALRLLRRPFVRQRGPIRAVAWVGIVSCLYIAGEEHSYGQHFFHWETPEFWKALNRQDETNFHNITDWLDKKPRTVLEVFIFGGSLALSLAAAFTGGVRRNRWSLFIPAIALVPTALGVLLFKLTATFANEFGTAPLVFRPAESTETFMYLFIVFYLMTFARRIRALEAWEAAAGRQSPNAPRAESLKG